MENIKHYVKNKHFDQKRMKPFWCVYWIKKKNRSYFNTSCLYHFIIILYTCILHVLYTCTMYIHQIHTALNYDVGTYYDVSGVHVRFEREL